MTLSLAFLAPEIIKAPVERDAGRDIEAAALSRRARLRHARAGAPQRPRRSLRVPRVGALTKAQSHLRLDKARIYLARHLPIEHPVPARMHLRGKFSQVRGFMVRVKTKSPDQICRGCCDLISAGIKEWQSHREALDLPTSEPTTLRPQF
jgi:hypothetical protein